MPKPQGMHAGRLRDRVRIEKPVETRDSGGQPGKAWEAVAEVYACVEPLSGRELWQAAQVRADVSHKATVRYRPDLHAGGGKWRLVWVSCQGFVLNVEYVRTPDDGGGRVWLEAFCKADGKRAE